MRAVSESFHYSKDAGFKVVTHMMPDLPNVDYERDVEQFIVRFMYSCMKFLVITYTNVSMGCMQYSWVAENT